MRKLIAVLLIMIFLVPVGAMAGITQPISKPTQATTIEVGDVINDEKVVWVASNINSLGENDVAYLTAVTTAINIEGGGSPCPIFWRIFYRLQRIIAYNQNNNRQFEDTAACRISFVKNTLNSPWYCTVVTNIGSYAFIWNQGYWQYSGLLQITTWGLHSATGHFQARQNFRHFNPPSNTGYVLSIIHCMYDGTTQYDYDYVADI
ncbi:MAG: hypothetical protein IMZ53_13720 [Thermoplasmata archaeon]|nr:hypothetical protein [Thermoplasmata archaeon]MBE3141629.1 hypothetical protein [Thermoplasmata archaeon]